MSGLKLEELTKTEQELFQDLKKILSQSDWTQFFFKDEHGLFSFGSESKLVCNAKLEVLKTIAYNLAPCVEIQNNEIVLHEDRLLSFIHSKRLGDVYYIRYIEKIILKYETEDLIIFIALLLRAKQVESLDQEKIDSYLKNLL